MSESTKVYSLRKNDWNDTFELHLSKTAKIMRNHINKMMREKFGIKNHTESNDTLGMVHPVLSTGNVFAYCFLNEENLTPGVIAHECGHIAMAHERFVLRFKMNYGDDCNDDEERMLHYMTSCIDGIYEVLKEHNKKAGNK